MGNAKRMWRRGCCHLLHFKISIVFAFFPVHSSLAQFCTRLVWLHLSCSLMFYVLVLKWCIFAFLRTHPPVSGTLARNSWSWVPCLTINLWDCRNCRKHQSTRILLQEGPAVVPSSSWQNPNSFWQEQPAWLFVAENSATQRSFGPYFWVLTFCENQRQGVSFFSFRWRAVWNPAYYCIQDLLRSNHAHDNSTTWVCSTCCFVSFVSFVLFCQSCSVLSDAWMSHHSHRTLQPLDAMAWKCDESNSPWLIEVSWDIPPTQLDICSVL